MAVTSRVDARYFIRPPVGDALNVALVAGPMYDPLYELLPEFEAKAGRRVHVAARLAHPELNAHLQEAYRGGIGAYDLVSTHNKYAPSQKDFLRPLDDWYLKTELDEFIPSVLELSRVDGWLLTLPRNIDVRLIYYRQDLFDGASERARLDSFRLVPRWSCYYWSPEHNLKVVGPDDAAALSRDGCECAPAKR